MPEELSGRQAALLEGLRDLERSGAAVDLDALAASTGYSVASIRTYFSKKLEGVLAFREGNGWRIRGAVRMAEATFARRMTQKTSAARTALETEPDWRALLRKLLYEGTRRHYTLSREELALVDALRPEVPAPHAGLPAPAAVPAPAPEEGEPQPGLFDRR